MKKGLLIIFALLLNAYCFSQTKFEKGYVIDKQENKIECLIFNEDWNFNPDTIQYKISEETDVVAASVDDIIEFGVANDLKYISRVVQIERSSFREGDLTQDKEPHFKEEKLFLKVLVDGKVSLYGYSGRGLFKFFHATPDDEITQLVYFEYQIEALKIGRNEQYKQFLLNILKCEEITFEKIKDLPYKKNSMIKLYSSYNNCIGENYDLYKKERDKFNLSVKAGVNLANYKFNDKQESIYDYSYPFELSFQFGIELEFNLPFNNNKWSVVTDPYYYTFKSSIMEYDRNLVKRGGDYHLDIQAIAIPVGLRHYFFFNDKSKLFINGFVEIDYFIDEEESIINRPNLSCGIGYKFNDKIAAEFRYRNRVLFNDQYSKFSGDAYSFTIGYTLF